MQYYLGVDIGTTSSKAVAFSQTGEVLCSYAGYYDMFHPLPDHSEQNADEVFAAVVESCNKVVAAMDNVAPGFIALSAAMHSIMAVDANGNPITNCIIWADNRAATIAGELHDKGSAAFFYHHTGVPVHAMSPLCKLFWFKQHQTAIYKKAFKFIGIKEYICYHFTGQYLIDTSVASSTGLLNIHSLQWDAKILDLLQLNETCLSEVVPPTEVVPLKQRGGSQSVLNIPNHTPLVIGASDGALANLGTGSSDGSTMVVTIGTSSAARVVSNRVELDAAMRTFCYHVKDDLYVLGGPGNNGAIVMDWFKEKILETEDSYEALFAKAERIEPGSESLLFLPYILGERAPIWNSKARGVFYGLDISHTQSHMIRACMEGVIFGVYSIAKILFEKRAVHGIHATGGFAQSSFWLQMLADVCNKEVCESGAGESSALGAVMLGIEALHLEPLSSRPFTAHYIPNAQSNAMYMESFEIFEGLGEALNTVWTKQSLKPEPIVL